MSSISQYESELRQLSWLWAYCYDTKDWKKLHTICSPEFKMFYGELDPHLGDKTAPVEDFIAEMSAKTALGDARLKTQHFLGAVMFEQGEEEGTATGTWQVQGLHRRYKDDGEAVRWNAYNYVQHFYRKDDQGQWKLDGLKPSRPLFMDGKPGDVIGDF
ncbi:hypothetical protein E4T47_04355 [Aureobasidium subglaciale]|nr:hypothetical protein E4T47_04355 [Aureobasidium subglaciale]